MQGKWGLWCKGWIWNFLLSYVGGFGSEGIWVRLLCMVICTDTMWTNVSGSWCPVPTVLLLAVPIKLLLGRILSLFMVCPCSVLHPFSEWSKNSVGSWGLFSDLLLLLSLDFSYRWLSMYDHFKRVLYGWGMGIVKCYLGTFRRWDTSCWIEDGDRLVAQSNIF